MYRNARYLGRADWTKDGHADLLVHWSEYAAFGTYSIGHAMVLTVDTDTREIQAMDYIGWFLENKERVRAVLTENR